LWGGACLDSLTLTNFGLPVVTGALSISFGADYADIFEVRGTDRPARGTDLPPVVGSGPVVTLRYVGLDGLERRTDVTFDGECAPVSLDGRGAVFEITLEPRESVSFSMNVACATGGRAPEVSPYAHA